METNNENIGISKAQIEVWEVKANLYEMVKTLPLKEAYIKLMQHSKESMDDFLNVDMLKNN